MPKNKPNARKGEVNRVTLSIRLTPETKAFIAAKALEIGISQGELIDAWGDYIKEKRMIIFPKKKE